MNRLRPCVLAQFALAVLLFSVSQAQVTTGTIYGSIADAAGSPLTNAKVTLVHGTNWRNADVDDQ